MPKLLGPAILALPLLMRKKLIVLLALLAAVPVLAGVAVTIAAGLVHRAAAGRVYTNPASLPENGVGLVLGTSKFSGPGRHPNPHFDHRMEAAAALFRAGKVRGLLLSGDNGTRGYDEPADMKTALLALGVPAEALTLDDAGFRTLDSVVRARKVFGQSRLTIITDRFHTYRAVFLARRQGIDAVALASEEVALRYSFKSRVRECLADVRACLDLYVLHTRPRFLGEPMPVHFARR